MKHATIEADGEIKRWCAGCGKEWILDERIKQNIKIIGMEVFARIEKGKFFCNDLCDGIDKARDVVNSSEGV